MARAIWTGSISFGLVSIPVRVFSAVRAHDVRFHQVAPDGSRIHVERVSEKSGRKVDFGDLKKGYETSKGKWVLFEKGELEQLAPASTKTIDIEDFVALDDIDPIYFERTYHLAPQGDAAASAYALLAGVMAERGRVGIGKVVMREKQYLAAVRPYGKGLALSTMLFADEVVPQSDIDGIPARKTVGAREKKLAAQILDSLASEWDPKRYHDDYEEQLRAIIRAKSKGKAVEVEAPAEESARVLDLVDALQASLEGRRPKRRAGKTASARKPRAAASKAKKSTKTTKTAKTVRKRQSRTRKSA